ncbi:putative ubiquitin carboxyl-terminal hydrolase 18-like [Capsicum annuum]|nr:putative ubiquitin carboxyl-terminal hydrolase 18-like [Capsicum annuum]KAF3682102.1 putative ubiquitin carboxyl-terminal hydrolase 18-like [Capsicum annuum]
MAEILMELANRAIQEDNEKGSNVCFKYKVLKIEKVNCSVGMYYTHWMIVIVTNLTLVTPIETFLIHASLVSSIMIVRPIVAGLKKRSYSISSQSLPVVIEIIYGNLERVVSELLDLHAIYPPKKISFFMSFSTLKLTLFTSLGPRTSILLKIFPEIENKGIICRQSIKD